MLTITVKMALIVLGFTLYVPSQTASATCQLSEPETCTLGAVVTVSYALTWLAQQATLPAGFQPPAGAGEVIAPPNGETQFRVCSLTPSTGQMSGVNVRGAPSMEAPVVDGIALGDFREIVAIGTDWHETITRDGQPGYVAARVAALVGPCGDVPQADN